MGGSYSLCKCKGPAECQEAGSVTPRDAQGRRLRCKMHCMPRNNTKLRQAVMTERWLRRARNGEVADG